MERLQVEDASLRKFSKDILNSWRRMMHNSNRKAIRFMEREKRKEQGYKIVRKKIEYKYSLVDSAPTLDILKDRIVSKLSLDDIDLKLVGDMQWDIYSGGKKIEEYNVVFKVGRYRCKEV